MGLFGSILGALGITYDIAENVRETKTDVKSNKPEPRKYDFDDGTGYTKADYDAARKKAKAERKAKGKKPVKKDDK